MKILNITITNKSPFSIATSRDVGNVQETLDFIPGTVVRGALAGLYLKLGKPDSDFKDIFTGSKVFFSNLYIGGAKPIPLSAYSCKYHGGFLGDEEKHGVMDMLIPLVQEKEMGIDLPDGLKKCQYREDSLTCGIETKRFKGYYRKRLSDDSLESVNISKRLIYRTAISHISETALENSLFSQEVIERGQSFRGEIIIRDDSLLNKIEGLIKGQRYIFMGSDKTIGRGKFEISYEERKGLDRDMIKQRISVFNKGLRPDNGKNYFSITLQSDAIVTDRYMRYRGFIDSDDLNIPGAELILGIAETRVIQGWNAMRKLPKEDVLAIEKGSVFVFSVDNITDSLVDRLFELEVYGIGKRRSEGFGRLTVCDPFHLMEGPK